VGVEIGSAGRGQRAQRPTQHQRIHDAIMAVAGGPNWKSQVANGDDLSVRCRLLMVINQAIDVAALFATEHALSWKAR
jgi:hypothetical protein